MGETVEQEFKADVKTDIIEPIKQQVVQLADKADQIEDKTEAAANSEVEILKEKLAAAEQRLMAELKEIESKIKLALSHIGAESYRRRCEEVFLNMADAEQE